MRVLPTVINLGEGLQPGTKWGGHADIVVPFKSDSSVHHLETPRDSYNSVNLQQWQFLACCQRYSFEYVCAPSLGI